jgi:hypothetical protein
MPVKRPGLLDLQGILTQVPDPLEGVLGRIPSHSVRAPRPLLQLKQGEQDGLNTQETMSFAGDNKASKIIQSLLLLVENAFNYLLDIEDIDLILRTADRFGGLQTY